MTKPTHPLGKQGKPVKKIEKRVKCFFCNQPIKYKDFGGAFKYRKKIRLFHNNIVDLVQLYDYLNTK